jgi:hypothetical protein
LDALESRIRDGVRDRQLDRGEFDRATRELNSIRSQEQTLRARGGGLSDVDRGMLQQRIDQLTRSIHWMREHGPMPGPMPGMTPPPPPVVGPPPPMAPGAWSLDRREDWIQQRINQGRMDGSLDRREAARAQRTLNEIRATQAQLTRRGHGRLSDTDRIYIEQRLDRLRDGLHWMRDNGERAPWMRP